MTNEERLNAQAAVVAKSWRDVLESFGVKNIKNVSFNGSYFNIDFASKTSAMKALECSLLSDYQYDLIDKMFKYRHRLVGAAKG